MRIIGQIGQPGPVRHIHDGVGHAVEDVHHGNVDIQRGALEIEGVKQQDKHYGIDQCADDQPDPEFSEPGPGVVHDHAHHRIIEGIPDPGGKEENADKGGCKKQSVGEIQHEEGTDHVADGIFANGTDAKCILLTGGDFFVSGRLRRLVHMILLFLYSGFWPSF